jgi:hypothetical protein
MLEAYIVYVILLAISPIIGKYLLNFVYPDVKTYVKKRKWMLFVMFGLAAYIPMALIALSEVVVPLYSPSGPTPALFEYEVNSLFAVILFFGVLIVNSSVIDFVIVRRKKTRVVGIPKHVIRFGIQKEMGKPAHKTGRNVKQISTDLEKVIKKENERKEVRDLIDKIRKSVEKHKEEAKYIPSELKKREEAEAPIEPKIVERKGEGAPAIKSEEEKKNEEERKKLIKQLEEKLKDSADDAERRERSQKLMRELKEKIESKKTVSIDLGVEEITQGLK